MNKSFRRVAASAAVTLVAAFGMAGAAEAAGVPQLSATGKAVGTISDSETTKLTLACEATGTNAFASVAITACYTTNGGFAQLLSFPGIFAATTNTMDVANGRYEVCVEAEGRLILGSGVVRTPLTCAPTRLGVGIAVATA